MIAYAAAIGMIGFSGLIIAGCIIYSHFDGLPFPRNPYFGDILGAGAAIVLSSLVIVILHNEHWFPGGSTNLSEIMDGLTLIWLPAAFGLWVFIAWRWNLSHDIQNPTILKKILRIILSFV